MILVRCMYVYEKHIINSGYNQHMYINIFQKYPVEFCCKQKPNKKQLFMKIDVYFSSMLITLPQGLSIYVACFYPKTNQKN